MGDSRETSAAEQRLEELRKQVPWFTSSRFGLSIIAFFGFVNLYALRVDMSVAIVCMVNHTAVKQLDAVKNDHQRTTYNATAGNDTLRYRNVTVWLLNSTTTSLPENVDTSCQSSTEEKRRNGPFVWDEKIQGLILGSFFYGYTVTQIPGGWLASKFGGKWVFGGFMLAAAISTLLMPVAARIHYGFLIVLRIICGLGSGVAFPAMHTMFASWAPPLERSKLANIAYAGTQIGNVITLPVSGVLCEHGFDGGWPSIFYILGSLGLVWCVLWFALVSNSPMNHKRISDIEKEYILTSLKGQIDSEAEARKKLNVPWKKMFLSMPVWAIIVANVTSDWGAYTFLTNIPTYMDDVLKFNIASNGLYSALPYIGLWAIITASGFIADKLRSTKTLTTTMTRKVLNTIGHMVPALFVMILAFLDCTQALGAVAVLTMGVSMTGFVYSSYTVNHVDIAPQYAGILFGISNSVAAVTGFTAPYVIGVIRHTGDQDSSVKWRIIFFIAAAVYLFGAVFYFIFATGDLQPWANKEYKEPLPEEEQLTTIERSNEEKETVRGPADVAV